MGSSPHEQFDIIFSYHSDDEKYVDFTTRLLNHAAPGLRLNSTASDKEEKLQALEKASCIVPILSPNYLESPNCMEELHIAIWRQRVSNPHAPLLFPVIVHKLPRKPTYIHLLDCAVSTTDALWATLVGQHHVTLPAELKKLSPERVDHQVSHSVSLALLMAAYRILQRFIKAR